ncbi:MAG: 16S rRNA processing protein RimM [Candidatus Latescibacteria bacterium]|nr:16S rRNA processing protein RimM [Candidatus Latescibacterota bacterium]
MTDSYVTIGQITKPHGVQGDVCVFPLTDYPERFTGLQSVYIEDRAGDRRQLTVVSVQQQPRRLTIRFAEVTTAAAAEDLRGCFLIVPREKVVRLPPGSFYVFDLIGMRVETEDGEVVGQVINVEHYPANDVYAVHRDGGGKSVLIPAIKEIVHEIDLQERRIRIVNRPGLLE